MIVNDLSLYNSVLLKVGVWIGLYLSTAQVGFKRESCCFLICIWMNGSWFDVNKSKFDFSVLCNEACRSFVVYDEVMIDEFGVLDPRESSRSTESSSMGFYSHIALSVT